jgi:hypothetical protein
MNFMFDLSNYEDVNSRIRRFQVAYPVGRIVTDVIQFNAEKGHVLISAQIYREHEDTLPAAVDYAFGDASTFNASMRKFYVEDTVTSAIGRALSLVLETTHKPTVQDMARAKLAEPKPEKYIPVVKEDDPWTIKTVAMPITAEQAVATVKEIIGGTTDKDVPNCLCGKQRILRTGTAKTGKQWAAWDCPFKASNYQVGQQKPCEPDRIWLELNSNGQWQPQKVRA